MCCVYSVKSIRYILLDTHTQVFESTAEGIISNEENRVIAVRSSIHSCTIRGSVHISKETFICVIFVCYNDAQSHRMEAAARDHRLLGVLVLQRPVGSKSRREVADRWVSKCASGAQFPRKPSNCHQDQKTNWKRSGLYRTMFPIAPL